MPTPQYTAPSRSQNLAAMAACVVLLVMATGAAGLYCLHLTHKRYNTNVKQVLAAEEVMETACQAQVTFKIQVQEWKNILIRGYTAEGMQEFRGRFEAREASVRQAFSRMQEALPKLNLSANPQGQSAVERLAEIQKLHTKLGESYRAALELYRMDDPLSFRTVDSKVRGMDRPIDTAIDSLVSYLGSEIVAMHARCDLESHETYASLQRTVVIISAITLVVTLVFAYMALRVNKQKPGVPLAAGATLAPMEKRKDSSPGPVV